MGDIIGLSLVAIDLAVIFAIFLVVKLVWLGYIFFFKPGGPVSGLDAPKV